MEIQGERRNGREVKMVLRIILKETPEKRFEAVCLELSLVSVGNSVDECIEKMKEAVHSYLEIIKENPQEKYVKTPVRFYWLQRLLFSILSLYWHQRPRDQWAFWKMRPVREECLVPRGAI